MMLTFTKIDIWRYCNIDVLNNMRKMRIITYLLLENEKIKYYIISMVEITTCIIGNVFQEFRY